jgi:uncharacterized membrane protein YgdD (TMEM256/DUF423 family)
MNAKATLLISGVLGLLGVALGAFGAHALEQHLAESGRTAAYELAVRYQFYHALALMSTGILHQMRPHRLYSTAALLFFVGVVLFSGSLYVLCFTGLRGVALVTPAGGLLLISGWVLFTLAVISGESKK